jgi:hypothetical protein
MSEILSLVLPVLGAVAFDEHHLTDQLGVPLSCDEGQASPETVREQVHRSRRW